MFAFSFLENEEFFEQFQKFCIQEIRIDPFLNRAWQLFEDGLIFVCFESEISATGPSIIEVLLYFLFESKIKVLIFVKAYQKAKKSVQVFSIVKRCIQVLDSINNT